MREKRFDGKPEELRSPERIAVLEVKTVIDLVLQDVQADSVLDAGTGSGLFAEAFHKQGLEAVCVDVSQDMLDLARQYLPGADLRLGKAEALPFPDRYCDLVFLGHVLHETDVPLQALKEARRVGRKRTAVLEGVMMKAI
ncbi:MAG: class I SAM-dependent methyltransferase [Anaerolineaceae bacterium]|nr:class I SAM-dependent methyltransferase [Anaerolineaceae bacterium]